MYIPTFRSAPGLQTHHIFVRLASGPLHDAGDGIPAALHLAEHIFGADRRCAHEVLTRDALMRSNGLGPAATPDSSGSSASRVAAAIAPILKGVLMCVRAAESS